MTQETYLRAATLYVLDRADERLTIEQVRERIASLTPEDYEKVDAIRRDMEDER